MLLMCLTIQPRLDTKGYLAGIELVAPALASSAVVDVVHVGCVGAERGTTAVDSAGKSNGGRRQGPHCGSRLLNSPVPTAVQAQFQDRVGAPAGAWQLALRPKSGCQTALCSRGQKLTLCCSVGAAHLGSRWEETPLVE